MAEYISRETAFVQPAVHCKDCKYAQNPNDTMVYCTYFECGTMSQNDFCSQGELRMAEYISREEAIKNLREVYEHEYPMASGDFDEYASHDMPIVLRNMKAADVQPVKRGKWCPPLMGQGKFATYCSMCQYTVMRNAAGIFEETPFCPHCGADMRGDTE